MPRVISGTHRGRRLATPAGNGTRPTSDRAREALFSAVAALVELPGARVLDLCAGSGAFGFEALSRGAAGATLVERDDLALAAIRANATALGLAPEIVAMPVEGFLDGPPRPYDLVLLDPPYELAVDPLLARLPPWVAEGGAVVVERRTGGPAPVWPSGLVAGRSRRYGAATLWYGSRS